MPSEHVARWLDHQQSSTFPGPSYKPPSADAFPLATISNPSSSSGSDILGDDDDDDDDDDNDTTDVANFVHPPTPSMEEPPATTSTRRRSSSLVGAPGTSKADKQKSGRPREEHILEEGEDFSGSDIDHSDSSERTESTDLELDDMRGSDENLEDDEETGLTRHDQRRRRRRKKRITQLDQRIVEGVRFTEEEEKLADQNLLHTMLINAALIGLWYLFSISISVYNKWMFKEAKGDGETENIFPFPLFTTCLHMTVQFTLASLVLFLIPSLRPRHDSLNPHAAGTRIEPVDPKKPLMTRWFYLSRIGPCGVATGMDIGLGNTSLKFISLTFFTMCKSSALGFVLIFAFLFRLEQPSWRLVIIILIMIVGVVMMVAGEAAFHALGFILVMASACSSGFRWSLTQILLLRNPATANPFSSIFFLAPVMFLSLFVLAVPVEGFPALIEGLARLFEMKGKLFGLGILIFPGVLAFLMTSSEFALLKRTSVVTLSICGIFKEVVTITTANFIFNDPLTPINLTGLLVTIVSIGGYNYMKIKKMRDDARMQAHIANQEEYAPVLTRDPDGGTLSRGSSTRTVRNSTRNTLILAPGISADMPAIDSPTKASPVKRPEDLE